MEAVTPLAAEELAAVVGTHPGAESLLAGTFNLAVTSWIVHVPTRLRPADHAPRLLHHTAPPRAPRPVSLAAQAPAGNPHAGCVVERRVARVPLDRTPSAYQGSAAGDGRKDGRVDRCGFGRVGCRIRHAPPSPGIHSEPRHSCREERRGLKAAARKSEPCTDFGLRTLAQSLVFLFGLLSALTPGIGFRAALLPSRLKEMRSGAWAIRHHCANPEKLYVWATRGR